MSADFLEAKVKCELVNGKMDHSLLSYLQINLYHHFASLLIPNTDPEDGFSYPSLRLWNDSSNYAFEIHFMVVGI